MGINTPSYSFCGIALLPSLFIIYSVATNKHLFSCMLSSKEIKWKVLCTVFYLRHRHVTQFLFCTLSRLYYVNSMLYELDWIRGIHPRELILTSWNSCIMPTSCIVNCNRNWHRMHQKFQATLKILL